MNIVEANEVITTVPALDLPPGLDLCHWKVDLAMEQGKQHQEGQDGENTNINCWEEEKEMVYTKVHGIAVFHHETRSDVGCCG
jgi:hypothetical protein